VSGKGHVYVLELSHGVIKVGCTTDPERRFDTHRRTAAIFGSLITSQWLSPAHDLYYRSERRLLHLVEGAGGKKIGREHFSGVSFDDAVACAHSISFENLTEAETGRAARFYDSVKSGIQRGLDRTAQMEQDIAKLEHSLGEAHECFRLYAVLVRHLIGLPAYSTEWLVLAHDLAKAADQLGGIERCGECSTVCTVEQWTCPACKRKWCPDHQPKQSVLCGVCDPFDSDDAGATSTN
jgi:hypothetical protein